MHINILETSCVYRLLCWIAPRFPTARRLLCLCDSNVARCAIHKGRSSSRSLLRALRRIAAVQVAFGLYVHLPYCPTRLMPADHPSRGAEIPEPGPPLSRLLALAEPFATSLSCPVLGVGQLPGYGCLSSSLASGPVEAGRTAVLPGLFVGPTRPRLLTLTPPLDSLPSLTASFLLAFSVGASFLPFGVFGVSCLSEKTFD